MSWIACKERLPEKEGKYLVSIMSGEHNRVNIATWIPEHNDTMYGHRKAKWLPVYEGNHDNVIAWMELPKSYGEDG